MLVRTALVKSIILNCNGAVSHHTRGIKTVGVIGSGLMGSGIAQVSAQEGYKVYLMDSDSKQLDKAKSALGNNVRRAGSKRFPENKDSSQQFYDKTMSNLSFTTDLKTCAQDADLIIEAIIEILDVKQNLYKQLDQLAPKECVFATNTSSLSLKDMGSVIERKDKFGGLHFFNPVPMMKLVEVVRTTETSDVTFESLMKFTKSIDKTPVTCRDTPGFLCNRLLVPFLAEAARLVERGDGTAADVDTAMKLGAGHPMGPFELADFIGLDTVKYVLDTFSSKLPDNPLISSPKLISDMVSAGKLGRKSGEGFFKYDSRGRRVS